MSKSSIRVLRVGNAKSLFHDREDLVLAEDQQLLPVDLDFGAGPARKEDSVPLADLVRDPAA